MKKKAKTRDNQKEKRKQYAERKIERSDSFVKVCLSRYRKDRKS